MKHYYLYFFALIFSVTLFFSFVTLQYNQDVLGAVNRSGMATSGFEAATYILYFVILFFVLYANHLFIKRRSKEIGLYQLIGMTKGLIIRLIAIENIILFFGAVIVGIIVGFFSSRLFAMILLNVLEKEIVVNMTFSSEAWQQSVLVFTVLLGIVLIQMAWMIRRVSLLLLFTAAKQADERVKRFSVVQMMVGFLGLVLIIYGYYKSTILFNAEHIGDISVNMLVILASTIGGTFLVFRYSVAFILNSIRLKKKGHLSGIDVLALTPIMHRMKSNAKSLTLITVLTGVSLGITTLSYISYYSTEAMANREVPADYIVVEDYGERCLQELDQLQIGYQTAEFQLQSVMTHLGMLLKDGQMDNPFYTNEEEIYAIPISDYRQINPGVVFKENQAILTNYNGMVAEMFPLVKNRDLPISIGGQQQILHVVDVRDEALLRSQDGPILVVSDNMFEKLATKQGDAHSFHKQTLVVLKEKNDLVVAENLYIETNAGHNKVKNATNDQSFFQPSYETVRNDTIESLGITIFTTAFLGLAFLMTTGSILYFKQMSEAEDERVSYTVLRKIGFSERDIMKGIYMKQFFNFGVPLIIGLLHSYFAVKSGWFIFGSELTAPLLIAMSCYVALYTIFAMLSVGYYKKVIRDSL